MSFIGCICRHFTQNTSTHWLWIYIYISDTCWEYSRHFAHRLKGVKYPAVKLLCFSPWDIFILKPYCWHNSQSSNLKNTKIQTTKFIWTTSFEKTCELLIFILLHFRCKISDFFFHFVATLPALQMCTFKCHI